MNPLIFCLCWIVLNFSSHSNPCLCAQSPQESEASARPIQVSLATESSLQPIAVVWVGDDSTTDIKRRLEPILYFDINHSGYLQSLQLSHERASINHFPQDASPIWSNWRELGAHYALYIDLTASSIRARLFDIHSKRSCTSNSYLLSGNLNEDRVQIHRLNDWLIEAITGQKGIACSRLLYTVDGTIPGSKRPRTQIWQSDYDGANAKMILEQDALLVTPCYLPHAGSKPSHFAFVSYKLGQPKILLASFNGKFRRASALGGSQLAPAIDSRGQQLAFICDIEGNPDVYWMKLDLAQQKGERARKIFASRRGTQASPTFSPDGRKLALVSSKDGNPRIYIINIEDYLKGHDPDKALLISRKNRENTCPCWSPNGRYIAYSARNTGARQIWIYDMQTQSEMCLTEGDGIKENPCWASNSLHLFYNQEDASGCHLYMIDLHQQKPTRVTKHRSPTRFPACSNE